MLNVFVYGTLRENEANDIGRAAQRSGLPQPRWLGRGSVKGTLYDLGAYPGLVLDTAAGEVYGDVFEIDETLLPVLDKIEAVFPHHPLEFQRNLIQVQLNGRLLPCQFYPVDAASTVGRTPIKCGDWVVHRRMRDHGAQPGEPDIALSKVVESAT